MNKPYVICNMMISLDGKISFGTIDGQDPDFPIFWDYMDMYEEMEATYGTDWSYMLGRITMDESDMEESESLDNIDEIGIVEGENFMADTDYKHFAVYTDVKGKLRWKENCRDIGGEKYGLVAIVTNATPKKYLAYLRSKNISYINGGEESVNFESVFSKLKNDLGIEKLLIEGGGSINGSVIKEDLIDEISLLMLPFVVNNAEAPELFYSNPKSPLVYNFKLEDVIKLERDVVRLKYLRKDS